MDQERSWPLKTKQNTALNLCPMLVQEARSGQQSWSCQLTVWEILVAYNGYKGGGTFSQVVWLIGS